MLDWLGLDASTLRCHAAIRAWGIREWEDALF